MSRNQAATIKETVPWRESPSCTLNNTKENLDRALDACRALTPFGQDVLKTICDSMAKEIYDFAPWAWEEFGGYYMYKVDWIELEKQFKAKIAEGE